ncbi:MAG: hypothetical protein WCC01_09095 [Acidimicrobiia bacterium]
MTTRNPAVPYFVGSVAGFSIAIALLAVVVGATSITRVSIGSAATGSALPELSATGSIIGLLVFLAGAIGGLLVSAATYAVGRAQDPDTPRFSFPVVAPVGVLLPAAVSFAVVSLGLSAFGTSLNGLVAVPVTEFVVVAAIAGLVAGAVTVPIVDGLSRQSSIGDANEATPSSSEAFWSDFGRAIGIPAVAIAVGALLAIGLAQLLLNADSTTVVVAVFSVVGALILGGTTLLALRPWDKD